jgi:hypothetical protein
MIILKIYFDKVQVLITSISGIKTLNIRCILVKKYLFFFGKYL